MKIEQLTPKQTARMAEFRDKWIKIGLSTEPADRPAAEKAIIGMYRVAGLAAPKIVWCGSPLSQGFTRAIILDGSIFPAAAKAAAKNAPGASVRASVRASVWASVGASVWDSVRDSVWDSVRDSVGDSVRDSVWDSVRDSVRDSIWDSVRASVRASVWDSVRDSVWDSVRDSVWDSVRDSVGDSVRDSVWDSVRDSVRDSIWDSVRASVGASVWDSVRASVGDSVRDSVWDSIWDSVNQSGYGQHDANWLAFYEFFRSACGLATETERLTELIEQAKSAGWYLPHKNICWVSERHNILTRDDRGRLHAIGGPAVAYPDGWKIYAIHGVRVPAFIVEQPETITAKHIEEEANAEVRRVMVSQMGMERYIASSNLKPVHADDFGTLYRKELAGDEALVVVKVRNSTPEPDGSTKEYFLRVPPTVTKAREAVAWTFCMKEEEYLPAVQT